jgi:hypothetical protein
MFIHVISIRVGRGRKKKKKTPEMGDPSPLGEREDTVLWDVAKISTGWSRKEP